jgi:hypothetical protein
VRRSITVMSPMVPSIVGHVDPECGRLAGRGPDTSPGRFSTFSTNTILSDSGALFDRGAAAAASWPAMPIRQARSHAGSAALMVVHRPQ